MDASGKVSLLVDEKKTELSRTGHEDDDHDKSGDDQVIQERDSTKSFSQNPKDSNTKQVDELESTRAQVGEVLEENERLKSVLAKILRDYQSLQSQIANTIKEQGKTSCYSTTTTTTTTTGVKNVSTRMLNWAQEEEDGVEEGGGGGGSDDLVSLSLGTRNLTGKIVNGQENKRKVGSCPSTIKDEINLNRQGLSLGLDLGLDQRSKSSTGTANNYLSTDNSVDEELKDKNILKSAPPPRSPDEHIPQQLHVKKARVSVRARCDAPTMSDGCQWRKYGQKISKGNPCPRAYYRCTVAPACPVRKQVQRCADDMSILITTYEGTHNHPLPMAATAMASTTLAAVSMLTSGSSASMPGITTSMSPSIPNTSLINGLNFNMFNSDITSSSASRQPYYLQPNPNLVTDASPHFPTITLDLTSPSSNPTPLSSSPPSSTQFNRFSNYTSSITAPRFSTNFNFSSKDSTITSYAGTAVTQNYLGFGSHPMINQRSQTPHEPFYYQQQQQQPSSLQKRTLASLPSSVRNVTAESSKNTNLTDSIAEAITTDPSFQSALAAAITSIVSGGSSSASSSTITSSTAAAGNHTSGSNGNCINNGCTPSFLMNRPAAAVASQRMQGNMMFLGVPSMGFSNNANGTASSSSASHVSDEQMN